MRIVLPATTGAVPAAGAAPLDAGIAGEAIAYMDSMPLAANVQFLTLLPTNMPFIGRG